MRSAVSERHRAFFIRPCRANQLIAQCLGPLASNQAHAACCCMEQNKITRLQAALRQSFTQQVLRREALEHHRSAGFKRNAIWQLAHALGRHHALLAICAWRLARVSRAVAHLQMRHTFANSLHHTCCLHAELQRQGQGIHTAPLIHINEI